MESLNNGLPLLVIETGRLSTIDFHIAVVGFVDYGINEIKVSINTDQYITWRSIEYVMNAIAVALSIHLRLEAKFLKFMVDLCFCCFTA